jgi:hypothetical protein
LILSPHIAFPFPQPQLPHQLINLQLPISDSAESDPSLTLLSPICIPITLLSNLSGYLFPSSNSPQSPCNLEPSPNYTGYATGIQPSSHDILGGSSISNSRVVASTVAAATTAEQSPDSSHQKQSPADSPSASQAAGRRPLRGLLPLLFDSSYSPSLFSLAILPLYSPLLLPLSILPLYSPSPSILSVNACVRVCTCSVSIKGETL